MGHAKRFFNASVHNELGIFAIYKVLTVSASLSFIDKGIYQMTLLGEADDGNITLDQIRGYKNANVNQNTSEFVAVWL
jgi:hypothetical protein